MDYHPKKNNRANQKSNHGHVVGRDQDSLLYTKQKQIKPHYPTLQYRGVYQKKKETKYRAKEKQNTEQKRNPKHPEQIKPTVPPPLLAGAARSVTSAAPRLVVVPRSPIVVARRPPSSLIAGPSSLARRRKSERSHHLSCSSARPIGLKVFLPLFLSDSLSLSLSLSLTQK